jgi:predicted dehydrogenase
MNTPLRLAFVGTGGIAKHHMRNLAKIGESQIVGTCDVEASRAADTAKEFGGKGFESLDRMLDETKPDALLICTPPFARLDPVRAACDRKIPFFCEKPPAFSLEDAQKVKAIVDASKVIHSVGFMYRHRETTDRAIELLKGQTLIAMRSTYVCGAILNPNFPAWFKLQEKSGGPMLDQAIHIMDLVRYVLGDIKSIYALGSNRATTRSSEVTVNDTLNVAMEFNSGLGGTHNHSWAVSKNVQTVEFYCRDARLTLDLRDNSLCGDIRGMNVEYRPGDDCYVTELKRFLQAVRTGDNAPIRSTYADAVKTLAVCVAANQSTQTGKAELLD